MIRKFNIELCESNLDNDFNSIETRQCAVSLMNYIGESKDANIQLIKDGCQELIRFYEENGDTNNFEPYSNYNLTDEEKCKEELKSKIKQVSEEFNKQHELLDQYELECTDEIVKLKNKRIAALEEEVNKYKKLLADKTQQFDSVRQRYHLLNRLQADYGKKDKLHLSEMQCLELVEQNEKLQEENAKLKEQVDRLSGSHNKIFKGEHIPAICAKKYEEYEEEIAKLKERLSNVADPKFKIWDDIVFAIYDNKVVRTRINSYRVFSDNEIEYYCKFNEDTGERIYLEVEDVFATEAEAQKYVEGLK